MARKDRMRNLALLGGLGAAALMMGKGEKGEKEDLSKDYKDTDTDIGEIKSEAKEEPAPTKPKGKNLSDTYSAASTGRSDKLYGERYTPPMEGRTASGLPREARGVVDTRTPGQKFAARQERAADVVNRARREQMGFKKGGMVGSASKRADGCATKGKTRGRMV